MGDDELNFTTEEALSWANDPRNQAREGAPWPLVLVVVLLAGLLIAIACLANSVFGSAAPFGPASANLSNPIQLTQATGGYLC